MHGEFYDHGAVVMVAATPRCIECECQDGSMHCKLLDRNVSCPKLNCPEEQQFTMDGECCKFCPGTSIMRFSSLIAHVVHNFPVTF